MKIFNFNRNNRLGVMNVVRSTNKGRWIHVSYWVSGRIFGKYISFTVPVIFRKRFQEGERFLTKQEYNEVFNIPT